MFFQIMPLDRASAYLMRDNVVLQANALYKAINTMIFCTKGMEDSHVQLSSQFDEYDGKRIFHWHEHIYAQERGFEDLFQERSMTPLRLGYQRLFADGADPVEKLATHFGVELTYHLPLGSGQINPHRKLGSDSNLALEARFRSDLASKLAPIDAERQRFSDRLAEAIPLVSLGR